MRPFPNHSNSGNTMDEQNLFLIESAAWVAQNAVNLLLQSTVLISVGLLAGWLLRSYGSAVQSAIYRATLAAVFLCPLAGIVLDSCGATGWTINLPETIKIILVDADSPRSQQPTNQSRFTSSHTNTLQSNGNQAAGSAAASKDPDGLLIDSMAKSASGSHALAYDSPTTAAPNPTTTLTAAPIFVEKTVINALAIFRVRHDWYRLDCWIVGLIVPALARVSKVASDSAAVLGW